MNKKGFTLVELLAVIVIIAILSIVAIPNTLAIIETSKKEHMLNDAKRLISIAKERVNANIEIRKEENHTFYFEEIKEDISNDLDGRAYNNSSFVKYTISDGTVKYCITLLGSKYAIGQNNCVNEDKLTLASVQKR